MIWLKEEMSTMDKKILERMKFMHPNVCLAMDRLERCRICDPQFIQAKSLFHENQQNQVCQKSLKTAFQTGISIYNNLLNCVVRIYKGYFVVKNMYWIFLIYICSLNFYIAIYIPFSLKNISLYIYILSWNVEDGMLLINHRRRD